MISMYPPRAGMQLNSGGLHLRVVEVFPVLRLVELKVSGVVIDVV